MPHAPLFADLVADRSLNLSRTEHRVARYFVENRHQVFVQSTMELTQTIRTSDATIIRTAKALGFNDLDSLRRAIAEESEAHPTLSGQLSRTIRENAGDLDEALDRTLTAQADAIATMRTTLDPMDYRAIVYGIADAREVAVFGLGPTASMAGYLCAQLIRMGLAARSLAATGLLLADEILPLKTSDVVFIMAYSRVYHELAVLLRHAQALGLQTVLVADSLQQELSGQVGRIVTVPRGKAEGFSVHSGTLEFLETLLVGLATALPEKAVASLDQLNRLRADLAGQAMALPVAPSET